MDLGGHFSDGWFERGEWEGEVFLEEYSMLWSCGVKVCINTFGYCAKVRV